MQMQPINPLGPLVAGAKKTPPNSGEDFNDSLLSVHGNSDAVPNCEPEITAKQGDEVHADADPMSADGHAGPMATQIHGTVVILPGQNRGTAVLTDLTASNFMQQSVAERPYPKPEGSPLDPGNVGLIQDFETGNLAPSTRQNDGTTLTDSRFAEILGLTAAPGSVTVQRLAPQKQRSWGPGVASPVTDAAGRETAARMAPLKISDQFLDDFATDNPGQNIHWSNPTDCLAAASHTPGTGDEPANLIHAMVASQNTIPVAVISQDGVTARIPNLSGLAENRIIDHLIQQVSIRSNPMQSRISIRLHPEELGHLKMELVANNEIIKAHIHVQTQQVQDILEKNLARLREGFEQQGLFLDEIHVSVNSESQRGPSLFNDQQTLDARPQTANATRTQESNETSSEETMIALYRSDSIISLRI